MHIHYPSNAYASWDFYFMQPCFIVPYALCSMEYEQKVHIWKIIHTSAPKVAFHRNSLTYKSFCFWGTLVLMSVSMDYTHESYISFHIIIIMIHFIMCLWRVCVLSVFIWFYFGKKHHSAFYAAVRRSICHLLFVLHWFYFYMHIIFQLSWISRQWQPSDSCQRNIPLDCDVTSVKSHVGNIFNSVHTGLFAIPWANKELLLEGRGKYTDDDDVKGWPQSTESGCLKFFRYAWFVQIDSRQTDRLQWVWDILTSSENPVQFLQTCLLTLLLLMYYPSRCSTWCS